MWLITNCTQLSTSTRSSLVRPASHPRSHVTNTNRSIVVSRSFVRATVTEVECVTIVLLCCARKLRARQLLTEEIIRCTKWCNIVASSSAYQSINQSIKQVHCSLLRQKAHRKHTRKLAKKYKKKKYIYHTWTIYIRYKYTIQTIQHKVGKER